MRLRTRGAVVLLAACAATTAATAAPAAAWLTYPVYSFPHDTDSAVRPDNIQITICVPGWASSHRPPTLPIPTKAGYVRDHRIALELGGNSTVANLQYQTVEQGKAKDKLENADHAAVCAGRMNLRTAQAQMRAWHP